MIEVLVPCTNVTRLGVGGKRVIRPEKLMPGYVLLNMRMDKDTWFSVKNSNNVQNFVGHDRARKNAAGGTRSSRNPYQRRVRAIVKSKCCNIATPNDLQNKIPDPKCSARIREFAGGVAGGRGHVVPTPLTRAEEKRIMDKITASRAEAIGLEAGDQVIFPKPQTLSRPTTKRMTSQSRVKNSDRILTEM